MDDAPYASFAGEVRPLALTSPVAEPSPPHMGEPACDDLPAAVGWMIIGSYVAILAAFAWAFFGVGDVQFNLGVCAVCLAMYQGVPWEFLQEEMQGRAILRPTSPTSWRGACRPELAHLSGRAALAQILTIPVALTFAALGIGIIIRNAG